MWLPARRAKRRLLGYREVRREKPSTARRRLKDPPMASDTSPSPAPKPEKKPIDPHGRPPRQKFFPPLAVWLVLLVCAAGIVFALRPGAYDHQIGNIVALILSVLAVATVVVWFAFVSDYGFFPRILVLVTALLAPAIFFTFFRIEQVSGELVPRFAYRFAPKRDEMLTPPAAGAKDVDLSPTPRDFPQFLGPNRDLTVPGIHLVRDWSAHPPQQMWRQPIGAGWSGFVAVHGFAITMEQRGDTELVTCYEIETGKPRWSEGVETRHETVLGGVGPRSTPTVYDGKVYALGATGHFRCLDGANGQTVWSKDLYQEFGVSADEEAGNINWGRAGSPLIVDDLVVVPAGGPTGKAVSLVAYDRLTGKEAWRGGERQISYASPSLATLADARQILIVNEDTLSGHAVETGRVLWSHPWEGGSNANASVSQAVVMNGDRVFVSKGYGGGALMLQVTRQNGAWNVSEIWRNKNRLKTKLTNIAVRGDYGYGLSDGILECVDLTTGDRQWKSGRYGHGQILLVDDALLVQAESGEVVLVEASPEEHIERGRFQAISGQTWNNLCLYGPYLLTRNSEEAACYRLPLAE